MIIKVKPSMKDTAVKVTSMLGMAGVGAGIAYGLGSSSLGEAIQGGVTVLLYAIQPQFIGITACLDIANEGAYIAGLLSAFTPVG